ncbi:MAG: hypothetical protein H6810_11930 [Phycisphaeraceae bacterium]|nr:MAG: hypothetical protein H6810_11930 [Phycisphaeraceae bacterium]
MRSSRDKSLREVAERGVEPAPVMPAPRPARMDSSGAAAQTTAPTQEGVQVADGAPDRGPRDGDPRRRFRRPSLGDSPMTPEDWADRWTEMQARRQDFMARFDTDGDGQISDSEREAIRAEMDQRRRDFMLRRMTDQFDKDGDGQLNDAERAEAEAEMEARRIEREAMMLARFDTDGDGQISDAERQAARDSWRRDRGPGGDRADGAPGDRPSDQPADQQANQQSDQQPNRRADRQNRAFGGPGGFGDFAGGPPPGGFDGGPAGGAWQQAIAQYDTNGDGQLDLDESYSAYLERFAAGQQRMFVRQYDTNSDGTVDASDMESFLTQFHAEDRSADINEDGVLNQKDVERFRDLMMTQK